MDGALGQITVYLTQLDIWVVTAKVAFKETAMTHELTPMVAAVAAGEDATELLARLRELDRDDRYGQSVIRYLMKQDRWDFSTGGDHDITMEHLFGQFPERAPMTSKEYLETTRAIVLENWGVELEAPTWEVVRDKPETKTKRATTRGETEAKKSHKRELTPVAMDGHEDAARYGTLTSNDIDTSGASDRLKKVIKIQRSK